MKICVVSFYTKNYEIGIDTETINKKYCLDNGYDYKCFYEIPDDLKDRHPAWCKLYYIDLVLKDDYDYVMWIDADAFFCNHNMKIENWIIDDKYLFICRDAAASFKQWNSYKHLLNSGVMIFKKDNWCHTILQFILNHKGFVEYYNKETWEQVGIRKSYKFNHHHFQQNCHIISDLNFNCNTNDFKKYITEGGFILHLTSFNGKWKAKNIDTINQFKKLLNI